MWTHNGDVRNLVYARECAEWAQQNRRARMSVAPRIFMPISRFDAKSFELDFSTLDAMQVGDKSANLWGFPGSGSGLY